MGCKHAGREYSEGSLICSNKRELKCRNGEWRETGYSCVDLADAGHQRGARLPEYGTEAIDYTENSNFNENGKQYGLVNGEMSEIGTIYEMDDFDKRSVHKKDGITLIVVSTYEVKLVPDDRLLPKLVTLACHTPGGTRRGNYFVTQGLGYNILCFRPGETGYLVIEKVQDAPINGSLDSLKDLQIIHQGDSKRYPCAINNTANPIYFCTEVYISMYMHPGWRDDEYPRNIRRVIVPGKKLPFGNPYDKIKKISITAAEYQSTNMTTGM